MITKFQFQEFIWHISKSKNKSENWGKCNQPNLQFLGLV